MTPIKEKSLLILVKEIIVEWCLSSTSHGIPNIAKSESKFSRIFWSLAFLASSIFCGYQIIIILIDVSKFPVYVNIEVVEEVPAAFPSITFCNLNPFNSADPWVYSTFQDLLIENNFSYDRSPNLLWLSASSLIKSYVYELQEKERKKFTIDFDKIIYKCKFNNFICQKQDFEIFYDFDYGNCFKFNPNGTQLVGKSGSQSGLRLEMFVGNSSDHEAFTITRGIRFLVHNHSETKSIFDHGQDAATGFSTEIKINRIVNKKLGKPYSTCVLDLTNSNSEKTKTMQVMFNDLNFKKYSKELCLRICFNMKLEQKCNCSDPSIQSHQNMTKCSTILQIPCKEEFFQNFFSNQATECNNDCPLECETYHYSTKLSFSDFYTNWYFDLIKKKLSESQSEKKEDILLRDIVSLGSAEKARKNVLLINFFYDETSITQIVEKPVWNIFSILSSIGGNLGLFVGISVLSFAELIDLISKLISTILKKKLKKNKLGVFEKKN